jgi:flagellar protein FlaG
MSNITALNTASVDIAPTPAVTPAVSPVNGAANGQSGESPTSTDATTAEPAPAPPKPVEPAQRLVISEGAQTGVYIYTILDRSTGQVLVQIPREEVMSLGSRPDYTAGKVIDTTA